MEVRGIERGKIVDDEEEAKIKYQLPNSDLVNLSIYNLLGQKVVTLVSQHQQPGIYTVEWDATGFASDLYICKMTTGRGFSGTRKLTLLK